MATINWTPPGNWAEKTGAHVSFTAPCDCMSTTGLVIGENTYEIVDANLATVTGVGGVYTAGAIVELVLDCENMRAYILNGAAGGDAIVAQGVSGSWKYTKWASGLAECFCTVVNSSFSTSPSSLGSLYQGRYVVSFPAYPFAFVEPPAVAVGRGAVYEGTKWEEGDDTSDMILSLSPGSVTSPPYVRMLKPTPPNSDISSPEITIYVKGRWQ